MKKSLSLLLAVVMLVSMLAVMGGSALAAEDGLELSIQNGSEPNTLDPNAVNANDTMAKVLHMYEGVMRYATNGLEVEPGMAESYDVSEDGLTYTFYLRDAVWSDGEPVTAGDFVYSWQRLVSGGYDNSNFIDMVVNAEDIRNGEADPETLGVEAVDDHTLVVSLRNPCTYFTQLLAAAVMSPVRQDMVETGDLWYEDPDTMIGNGPFVLTEWVNQDHITMEANPNYWEAEKVGPSKITWTLMDDDNSILASFESGDIMYSNVYPTEELARLSAEGYVESKLLAGTYYCMINFDEKNPNYDVWSNPDVRKALALAIDRQYIQDVLKVNSGEVAADTFVGPGFLEPDGSDFHDNSNKWWDNSTYEENLEQAKQLLADAGYPNGEGLPTLAYSTNTGTGHEQIATFIQDCWEKLGVTMTIDQLEWAVFLDVRNTHDYEVARGGWTADFFDPASLMELWITGGGNNDAAYSNPEYDALYKQAQAEPDPAARLALFHQAEDLLMEDCAVIPIYYYSETYLVKNDEYTGYFDYLGFPMFKYTTTVD